MNDRKGYAELSLFQWVANFGSKAPQAWKRLKSHIQRNPALFQNGSSCKP